MALFNIHKEHEGCLWAIWKVEETTEQLLAMLPHKEKYRLDIEQFASPGRKLEWLAVRVLLYTVLKEEKEIRYRPDGKPYLADGSMSISISHTRGYAAIITDKPGKNIGIDIEQYGERVRKISSKFMRPDEIAGTYNGTDTWGLLLHWSAKEALFKCLNSEEVDFREHLQIKPFPIEERGVFQATEYRTSERQSYPVHYRLYPDFVLTFICQAPTPKYN